MTINNNYKNKNSTLAVIVTSLYLLTVAVSLAIMLMTASDTPMSGIFLVVVTIPWSFVLSWLQSVLHFENMTFTTLWILAILNLGNIPLGTGFGIYAIWVLLKTGELKEEIEDLSN